METASLVPTKSSLLRADQIEEMDGEKDALVKKLQSPAIQDKGTVREQLRRLESQLEAQRPKPFEGRDQDAALARATYLREKIRDGMLSHEEMRKNPPGAVDRHREWEKRNKPLITEWQNLQRRINAGSDARDIASIETFRPVQSTMNMDGAQIPGKQFFMPDFRSGMPVTFTDEQLALLRALNPGISAQLASLDNGQRATVKEALDEALIPAPKRTMTPEHKAKMAAGRDAAKARKAA